MAAPTTAAPSLQGVPEILARETEAEQRVSAALAACVEAEATLARTHHAELQRVAADAQSTADAEVATFEQRELATIEERATADAEAQLKMIDADYKKHGAPVTQALLKQLKDPALLS